MPLAYYPSFLMTGERLGFGEFWTAGVALGSVERNSTLVRANGPLARRWWAWTGAAVVLFVGVVALRAATQFTLGAKPMLAWVAAYGATFAVTCSVQCFALLAIYLRFATGKISRLDGLQPAAFGVYIVHYVFVVWAQYALLGLQFSARFKMAATSGHCSPACLGFGSCRTNVLQFARSLAVTGGAHVYNDHPT